MHIVAGMSRSIELLKQSQKTARIGAWEWIAGDKNMLWTDEMFHLLELEVPDDNMIMLSEAESLIHFDEIQGIMQSATDSAKEITSELEYVCTTATGKQVFIHCWFQNFYDHKGTLLKIRGTCQDVSAFKKTEEDLDRKNDMLQQAEETAKLGSWKYNFNTQQVHYSDSIFHLFGYENRAFENDTQRIFEHIFPEDVTAIYNTYQQTIADGKERSVEFRLNRNGEIRYFSSRARMTKNKRGEQIIVGNVQDITDQYLLNKKLEAHNDFVQKLVDSSVNCVLVLDAQKKYVLWNKKCEDLYGFSREKVIGKTVRQVFNDHDVKWFEDAIDKALNGENIKLEDVPSSVTGKYYEMNLIPLRNIEEEITQVFVLIHDITELKKLNEQIKKQKDFAEALVDNSQACIFVFDRNFKHIAWNKKCEEFYGIPKENVLGKTLQEVFPGVDVSAPLQQLEKALQGEPMHYPAEPSFVIDKHFDIYIVPMKNEQGEVTSILCVLNDVTDLVNISSRAKEANRLLEQKKNELAERTYFLETLLDTSVDYIGAYDKDFKFLMINAASCERYGLKKEDVIGRHVTEVFPGIENTVQMRNLEKSLQGLPVDNYEFQSLKGDKFFSGSFVPLKDKDNNIFGALAIAHDITDIKKTMQALEELNNQLASKNHELNRINSELASFSYVASHDLQEPLRKIQAFISLIFTKDFKNLSESARDYFKRIQTAANRMQQMIDGLLSFSRTNTTEKIFEEKALSEILQKVRLNLQDEIIRKQAIIETNTPHTLLVITHQFEQLLEQIIGNALKFQKEDAVPRIQIASNIIAGKNIQGEVAMRNKNYCRITIKDNGVGFNMEDAEKIFQMFQRLHGKTEYPGTGIGLAVCRRIAQNHNGFITVESEPEKGTCFHIFIPTEE